MNNLTEEVKRMRMFMGLNINEAYEDDGKIGINLRSLLDGELAMAAHENKLGFYKERNEFIDKIEDRLRENDWISLSNGTTFSKTFTPSRDAHGSFNESSQLNEFGVQDFNPLTGIPMDNGQGDETNETSETEEKHSLNMVILSQLSNIQETNQELQGILNFIKALVMKLNEGVKEMSGDEIDVVWSKWVSSADKPL
jgi:hypothetical protein